MPINPLDQQLLNNATVTANGSATFQNLQNELDPLVELLVRIANAPTGTTPTLQFTVAVSNDGVNFDTIYNPAAQFAPGTANTWLRVVFSNSSAQGPILEPWIKVSWVVGGTTPSYTGVYADMLFSNPTEL
jgi:hypothetical protein